jgi:hypothetical protein
MKKGLLHVLGLIGFIFVSSAQELIIGEERIEPVHSEDVPAPQWVE